MFDLRHTLDLMEDEAFDEAVSALRQAIAQMPAYVPAYVLLAQAYEAQERWPEALETWQRAHFFAPNSPTVEAGLLRVLDERDIMPDEIADEIAPDLAVSDATDRMANELLETIHEEDFGARPSTEPSSPSTEPEAESTEESTEEAPGEAAPKSPLDEEATAPETESFAPEPPADEDTNDESEEKESAPRTEETEPSAPAAPDEAVPPQERSPLEELANRLPDPDQPLPEDLEDLDRLIDELESARIDPQPDLEDAPAPDLDNDIEDMVSETLARIYISQNQYEEAARVYLRLASQEPERAKEYLEKAADMRSRARGQDEE